MPKSNNGSILVLNYIRTLGTSSNPLLVSLWSGDPTISGSTQLDYSGYAKQPITFYDTTITNRQISNNQIITFPITPDNFQTKTFTHAAIYYQDNIIYYGGLSINYSLTASTQITIPVGSVIIQEN